MSKQINLKILYTFLLMLHEIIKCINGNNVKTDLSKLTFPSMLYEIIEYINGKNVNPRSL